MGSSINKEEALDLLSTFHYVVGGLAFLFSFFPIFHLAFGVLFLFAPEWAEHSGEEAMTGEDAFIAQLMGGMFVIIAAAIMLCGFAVSILILLAGRKLRARRSRTFCLVVAGIECLFMPFGTVLGIFTIITLLDDEAIALFPDQARRPA